MKTFKLLALLLAVLMIPTVAANAQVTLAITVGTPPPVIPLYAQPAVPAPNYIWEPGYWAWGPGGYYWVPGAWVLPPAQNLYWTPGYWNWNGSAYQWMPGYWAPQVGYYGGIDYGGGYYGNGYAGGMWSNNVFVYNTYVTNVVPAVVYHRVYRRVYVHRRRVAISYVGGRGGLQTRPTAQQVRIAMGRHYAMTSAQRAHEQAAAHNRNYHAVQHAAAPVNRAPVAHTYQHAAPAHPVQHTQAAHAVQHAQAARMTQHAPAAHQAQHEGHAAAGHEQQHGGEDHPH